MHSPWDSGGGRPLAWRRAQLLQEEAASAQAGTGGVGIPEPPFNPPLPPGPLLCSTHKGPGQQGREAEGEGDHLRLWGVRVRGASPARPLRVQDSQPRDPALVRRVRVVALLGVSLEHASPSMAWASCGSFPGMAVGPGVCTGAPSPRGWLCMAFLGLCCQGPSWAHQCGSWTFLLVK